MTKCTMNLYGASGTLQNYDALCVMPVNMLNEKVLQLKVYLKVFNNKDSYFSQFEYIIDL